MKISIIIPCYNEKFTIEQIIDKVRSVVLPCEREIVVVDDCSSDGTTAFLRKVDGQHGLKVIFHEKNQGKGFSLRTGFAEATGDIIIIQDVDLEYNPSDYIKLLEPILAGKADVVYGSRFIGDETHHMLNFWHAFGNKSLTALSNVFTHLDLTDMEVCYKVFRKSVLDHFELCENRFGFEPEFTAKVSRAGYKIHEVGISYVSRTYAEGKKISWKDCLRTVYVILRYGLIL